MLSRVPDLMWPLERGELGQDCNNDFEKVSCKDFYCRRQVGVSVRVVGI